VVDESVELPSLTGLRGNNKTAAVKETDPLHQALRKKPPIVTVKKPFRYLVFTKATRWLIYTRIHTKKRWIFEQSKPAMTASEVCWPKLGYNPEPLIPQLLYTLPKVQITTFMKVNFSDSKKSKFDF
jgi:hypothetical protein